jgi:hypothetical protein
MAMDLESWNEPRQNIAKCEGLLLMDVLPIDVQSLPLNVVMKEERWVSEVALMVSVLWKDTVHQPLLSPIVGSSDE